MTKRQRSRGHCAPPAPQRLMPLGALAAGFGFAGIALAQTPPDQPASAPETVMPSVRTKAAAETSSKESLKATETRIGKSRQELRDVPQSVTVVTERLIDDRNLDTLKDALKNTAGISFQAAEGGEEDIRLRGFSLQSTGDIFVDGLRDPTIYERDSFNWDRLEVLRGSASMLFGRGSTGGVVNQVSKQASLLNEKEVAVTVGSDSYLRGTGDFNLRTSENAALRINAMGNVSDNPGTGVDKNGLAGNYRFGIGTADEFSVDLYHLDYDNNINYGIPWIPTANGSNVRTLVPGLDADAYYGLASDYSAGDVHSATLRHTHRFGAGSELTTVFRAANYHRDLRSGAVRFRCLPNAQTGLLPEGCSEAVNANNLGADTVLTRGGQNKIQAMQTRYLQSDYSGRFKWLGLENSVQTGVDLAHEQFANYAAAAVVKPTTTIGTPDDGASIDESLRAVNLTRTFDAKALGVYVQDLVQVAPAWKVLGGVRWDRFEGKYWAAATTGMNPQPEANRERTDSLWSKRFGVMYQPTERTSFHFSYGTSFNTSGDTYQYDAASSNVGPEKSRNVELGAKLDSADGRFSTRFALFHATKYNERNRDDETATVTNYVLSGERHAAGVEVDLAGRITPAWEIYLSYAWIPDAEVDKGTPQALQQNGEAVGSRPGLTPKHTGTVWTTYKLTPHWRIGGGLNARSSDKPSGLQNGTVIKAAGFVTADVMAEYSVERWTMKLNVTNVTDKYYADMLYRGHYIPGKPRTVQLTTAYKF